MALKLSKEKQEHELVRTQRQELKAELAENYANRPRRPRNRRRTITFLVLGVIALLAVVFGFLVLLPSPAQQPTAGVSIGTAAPAFDLPIYGGSAAGRDIQPPAFWGDPHIFQFWARPRPPPPAGGPLLPNPHATKRPTHPISPLRP